jgi:hypothetical protein
LSRSQGLHSDPFLPLALSFVDSHQGLSPSHMGIQGLLPLLKPFTRPVHVSDLRGQCVGVDAYVWLHRGAYACAVELAQGKDSGRWVMYNEFQNPLASPSS